MRQRLDSDIETQSVPLVSVITVCYNSATTLASTLASVANQSWQRFEHIIIDGGSTDGTIELIDNSGQNLTKVVSEPDHGIYDAMNKGLDLADGDIICFLNADDQYASPDVLSRVVLKMEECRLDALLGDVAFFRNGNLDKLVRRYRSERFHPDRLAWGWMPAHPALFLRREVVERVGRFKTDYRIAGDFEFIVRVFSDKAIRYQHIPEVLVKMQIGGVSTAGGRAKLVLNKEVLRACRENGINTNLLKILSKYPAKLLELVLR